MPLRLEIKRLLSNRSERVKAVDFHPTEPWLLTALYNGNVHIWHTETQQVIKSFEVAPDLPVRAAKFIARKSWIVAGSDDMQVRVFNYNTHEKVLLAPANYYQVIAFDAHADYIRSIAVHHTQPFLLTSSDDMLIKLWDWEKGWKNVMVFEGHSHYVMQVCDLSLLTSYLALGIHAISLFNLWARWFSIQKTTTRSPVPVWTARLKCGRWAPPMQTTLWKVISTDFVLFCNSRS